MAGAGLALIALYLAQLNGDQPEQVAQATAVEPSPPATMTPTQTTTPAPRPTQTPWPSPTATTSPTETATPTPSATMAPQPIVPSETPAATRPDEGTTPAAPVIAWRERFGVSGHNEVVTAAHAAGLVFGNYLNWRVEVNPALPVDEVVFWQMVPVNAEGLQVDWPFLETVVAAQPGATWIVGNEPDVIWQSNVSPERYVEIYHDVYTFIKERDPSARLAIAAVSQSTPLRRAYLDRMLNAYQAAYGQSMPVDVWTVHGFTLREEAGSWGVGIPPGMDVTQGELYEIADHDDLGIFRQNLVDFRAWMAARGYGDRPLAVTEFGILQPSDYGFPLHRVANFMLGAVAFFLEATGETGYQADDGRLVQWWFWYSVYDEFYPTGNLFDPASGRLTPLGELLSSYARG